MISRTMKLVICASIVASTATAKEDIKSLERIGIKPTVEMADVPDNRYNEGAYTDDAIKAMKRFQKKGAPCSFDSGCAGKQGWTALQGLGRVRRHLSDTDRTVWIQTSRSMRG